MRINKVTLRFWASSIVLVLLAASLSSLIFRESDPFKAPTKEITAKSLQDFYTQDINWQNCYGEFQCAKYQVPIDYDNLDLGTFDIAVLMRPSANAIGNLVINPGGPGGSGVDYAYSYQQAFTPEIINSYNIVGFDPRGVSRSAPIKCLSDAETDEVYSADAYPESDSDIAKLQRQSKEYAQSCVKDNEFLKYYGTVNAARDMDILRELLGDKELNYLGKSYGTFLATLYAQIFPEKVGRFVLDGAVDPTLDSQSQALQQAIGFDQAFSAFAADCKIDQSCVFKGDAMTEMQASLSKLKNSPIKVGNRELTESLAVYGIAMGLYDKDFGWPALRKALKDLANQDGKALLDMADAYTGRNSDGEYRGNEVDALAIISCNDFPPIKIDAEAVKAAAPLFGKYVAYGDLTCNYLPRTKVFTVKDSIPLIKSVLVIGTTNDPATPYRWAVRLSEVLVNSRLISLNSDGHTGYNRGSVCVDQAVESYLISGQIPAENLSCNA
ncbi:MAG: alpha/beta hydrolase [Candidatus Nanopelagicaceae bacterium]